MKLNLKIFVAFLLLATTFSITSCSKEEEEKDITTSITNTYTGSLSVANGTVFQSTDYSVTVTKINNTKIKITPEDSNASTFEVEIKEGSGGSIISVNQSTTIVVTFSGDTLAYTYTNSDGQAEVFSGTK